MSYRVYTICSYFKIMMEGIPSPYFHEDLLRKLGPEDAYEEIEERLSQNPNDVKARQQGEQLLFLLEKLSNRLRESLRQTVPVKSKKLH